MWDVFCITAGVGFFLVAIAYTYGCERLGTKPANAHASEQKAGS